MHTDITTDIFLTHTSNECANSGDSSFQWEDVWCENGSDIKVNETLLLQKRINRYIGARVMKGRVKEAERAGV